MDVSGAVLGAVEPERAGLAPPHPAMATSMAAAATPLVSFRLHIMAYHLTHFDGPFRRSVSGFPLHRL
jgi:hypothetical protein